MTATRATLAGLAGLAALVALALAVGAQGFGWGDGGAWALLRAPRVLAALAAGLALGVGGAAQQGVFRNPLADPGLTGVFGGALFGLALLLGAAPETAWRHAWLLPAAAFAGALGSSALLVLCGRGGSSARLLLTGLGLNAFTAAGTLVIAARSGESRELLTNGAYGDWLGMATFELTWLPALLCLAATLLLLPKARALDLLAFGDDAARGFGADVAGVRRDAVLLTALAAAAATCLVGQVAFIGLLAPHLARALVGPRHAAVLPGSALLGGALLLVADTLGRGLWAEAPLSAAAVTAVLGAPLFIWIARSQHD
ncbi:MAG: iron ABC transporter permease [Verrucomicrobia bacterium]|nr:iron ABC transporter permease [Verrucomicrobiota bacterium]